MITPRKIKIEEMGADYPKPGWPLVRLKGKWLGKLGLAPGKYLTLTQISAGVLELRLAEPPPPPSPDFYVACGRLDKALAKSQSL
jgi:hypothetical protein